jgi:phosphohistidine phosphatase
MRIVLFRHGPAGRRDASRWPDDALRPLSPKGIDRSGRAAIGLARLEGPVDHIVSSPLVRAFETARLLHEAMAHDRAVEKLEALSPGGSPRAVIQKLAEFDENATVVLVGHEPDLSKLGSVLTLGAPAEALALKKAGACVIDTEGLARAGAGWLVGLYPPRVLRRLGRTKSRV